MIAIPRSLARQFRAVLRRCAGPADRRRDPFVLVRSAGKGLSLESVLNAVAVRVELQGQQADNAVLAFPGSVLAQCEGPGEDLVTLEETSPGKGSATWLEGSSRTTREFNTVSPDTHLCFPPLSRALRPAGPSFLLAMHEAAQTAAQQVAGRSLDHVQLRGSGGQIVATNGRQLLMQRGFTFPWKENLLVPRVNVWACRELPQEEEARVGHGDKHVFIHVGAWTFALTFDTEGRFPEYEKVVPATRGVKTRLRFDADDIRTLLRELPRLPGGDEKPGSVRVEIGKEVVIRSDPSANGSTGELKLERAQVTGQAVKLFTDRFHLLRALELGFVEIEITSPSIPLCCRDNKRVYVWMPLNGPEEAAARAAQQADPNNHSKEEPSAMPEPNGKPAHADDGHSAVADPLTEAEAIRDLLGEAQSRLARLIGVLKQHRRQTRAVHAAMRSLRDLPPLTP